MKGVRDAFVNTLLAILSVTASFAASEQHAELISVLAVVLIIFKFKFDLLSPFFYLAPAALYFYLSLKYASFLQTAGFSAYLSTVFLGLLAFIVGLKTYQRVNFDPFLLRPAKIEIFVLIFLCSICILHTILLLSRFESTALVAKALQLSFYPVAVAAVVGALSTIATRSFCAALLLSLGYFSYLVFSFSVADDFSRLAVLDFFSMILLFAYAKFHHYPISRRLMEARSRKAILALLGCLAVIFSLPDEQLPVSGDLLLVDNGAKVVSLSANNHEFLMPAYNAGMLFLPFELMGIERPAHYNSSGWYIKNILDMPPSDYGWGVGVTLFAASYLYGGLAGVACLFFAIGAFTSQLSRLATNPFWAGFFCYFLYRIPLAFFRMDETFLLGSVVPMLGVLFIFLFVFNRHINRAHFY